MKNIIAAFGAAILFATADAAACDHVRVLGATYGNADVSDIVSHQYNMGEKVIDASADNFGDPMPNVKKVLTVVYEKCGNPSTVTALDGDSVELP